MSNRKIQQKEMSEQEWKERWGIAFVIVLIIAYFALVLFLTFSGSNLSDAKVETVIEHYTYIVVVIIVFYFGFRSVEEYLKLKGKQAKPEQKQDTQSGASNNKGNMRENQDAGLDLNRIEQKMERASFVNYMTVVGGFTAAAGVALLVTLVGIYLSLTLGSSAILDCILMFSGLFLLIFGVCMIRYAHDMYPPKLSSEEKGLIHKETSYCIIIAVCISVSIVLLLTILNVI
jgi:hypothetical protein